MLTMENRGIAQPTWIYHLSLPGALDAAEVAQVVADATTYGAVVTRGYGAWEGEVEQAVTVRTQAPATALRTQLRAIRVAFPTIEWVHVECHDVKTWYVDIDTV